MKDKKIMAIDVSIIIVSYNTLQLLKNCLDSIYNFNSELRIEIIVIDNASSDGTIEMIMLDYPSVRLIINDTNKGFAYANNRGISIAKGKYVLLLNSDTLFINDSLSNSINYIETNKDVDILGVKLLNADMSLQPSCREFPTIWNLFTEASFLYLASKKSRIFGSYYMNWFDHNSMLEVDFIAGAFMLIRKEVFDEIGYFDEDYFMYSEEMDLCFRAKKHGLKIIYFPFSSVIHFGGGSISNKFSHLQQNYSTQFLFFKKHFRQPFRFMYSIFKWSGLPLRFISFGILGILKLDYKFINKSWHYFKLTFFIY